MCTGWLERHGCAEVVPEPGAARGKVVRLTDKGRRSRRKFARVLRHTEQAWRTTYGMPVVAELRDALAALTGDGTTIAATPLAPGLEPAPATGGPACAHPRHCRTTRWCCTAGVTPTVVERRARRGV